jgi:hypothetical protein
MSTPEEVEGLKHQIKQKEIELQSLRAWLKQVQAAIEDDRQFKLDLK